MSDETQTPETTASTEQTSQPVSVVNQDGTWNADYLSSLPDDLGKHSSFEKYKTFDEYVKGSINAQNLVGQKASDFWKSEDPEHVAARREIMGIPKEPTEYEFNVGDLPEGLNKDMVNQRIDAAKSKFHELGLSKEQAEQLIKWDIEGASSQMDSQLHQIQESRTEAEKALREDWKGDKYENNIEKARNALDYLGLSDWAKNPALGDNPQFIKDVFDKLVPLVSDDTIIEARQQQSMQTLDEQYNSVYDKMQNTDPGSAEYQKLIRQMEEITAKMN